MLRHGLYVWKPELKQYVLVAKAYDQDVAFRFVDSMATTYPDTRFAAKSFLREDLVAVTLEHDAIGLHIGAVPFPQCGPTCPEDYK